MQTNKMVRKNAHTWQFEERDALEILYKEYDFDNGNEVDAHSIFTHLFPTTGFALTRIRDEWRGRFKTGRNKNWAAMHSKTSLNMYTIQEQTRRAAVRVRIVQAAATLAPQITLAPIARVTALHNVARATAGLAGPGAAAPAMPPPAPAPVPAPPQTAPATVVQADDLSNIVVASSRKRSADAPPKSSTGPAKRPRTSAHQLNRPSKEEVIKQRQARSSHQPVDHENSPRGATVAAAVQGARQLFLSARTDRDQAHQPADQLPVFAQPSDLLDSQHKDHIEASRDDSNVRNKPRGHRTALTHPATGSVAGRQLGLGRPTVSTGNSETHSASQPQSSGGAHIDKVVGKTTGGRAIVVAGPDVEPVPRPNFRHLQARPSKMNMVHYSLLCMVSLNDIDQEVVGCYVQDRQAMVPYDSKTYQRKGVVAEIWFKSTANEITHWQHEACMICNFEACTFCKRKLDEPLVWHSERTLTLPFVHEKHCVPVDDGVMVFKPDGDLPHGRVEGVVVKASTNDQRLDKQAWYVPERLTDEVIQVEEHQEKVKMCVAEDCDVCSDETESEVGSELELSSVASDEGDSDVGDDGAEDPQYSSGELNGAGNLDDTSTKHNDAEHQEHNSPEQDDAENRGHESNGHSNGTHQGSQSSQDSTAEHQEHNASYATPAPNQALVGGPALRHFLITSGKMNMVHRSLIRVIIDSTTDEPQIHCTKAGNKCTIDFDDKAYKHGGPIGDVWFPNFDSERKVQKVHKWWIVEPCMVCDPRVCAFCDEGSDNALTDELGATEGLGLVHRKDCDVDSDGQLVFKAHGPWKVFDRNVTHSLNPRPWKPASLPALVEEKTVKFTRHADKVMVCVRDHCEVCKKHDELRVVESVSGGDDVTAEAHTKHGDTEMQNKYIEEQEDASSKDFAARYPFDDE